MHQPADFVWSLSVINTLKQPRAMCSDTDCASVVWQRELASLKVRVHTWAEQLYISIFSIILIYFNNFNHINYSNEVYLNWSLLHMLKLFIFRLITPEWKISIFAIILIIHLRSSAITGSRIAFQSKQCPHAQAPTSTSVTRLSCVFLLFCKFSRAVIVCLHAMLLIRFWH